MALFDKKRDALNENVTDEDRQFYIDLVRDISNEDDAARACIEAGLDPRNMTLGAMKSALLEYYRSAHVGKLPDPDNPYDDDADVELSVDDYLKMIDELSEPEAIAICDQEAVVPLGPSLAELKATLRSHFLGRKGKDAMRARFARYDIDGDGVLGKSEVTQIITDVGYKADNAYVDGAIEIFGQVHRLAPRAGGAQ